MPRKSALAPRLEELRVEAKYTAEQLREELGLSKVDTIRRWEDGTRIPSTSHLRAFSRLCRSHNVRAAAELHAELMVLREEAVHARTQTRERKLRSEARRRRQAEREEERLRKRGHHLQLAGEEAVV